MEVWEYLIQKKKGVKMNVAINCFGRIGRSVFRNLNSQKKINVFILAANSNLFLHGFDQFQRFLGSYLQVENHKIQKCYFFHVQTTTRDMYRKYFFPKKISTFCLN